MCFMGRAWIQPDEHRITAAGHKVAPIAPQGVTVFPAGAERYASFQSWHWSIRWQGFVNKPENATKS